MEVPFKSLIKVFLQHALFCDACDRCLYMISDAVSISRQFKFVDHVYFVHPSTDISVDISICDGRHIGRLSAGVSSKLTQEPLNTDCRRSIGRLSVEYRSKT